MAVERKQKENPKNVLPKSGLQKKELLKRKTPFSNTFVNPNGTFSTEVSSTPINYKNKSGNWRSVDNRLLAKSEGGYDYENAANAFRAKFAHNNFDGRLVRIELDLDQWIALHQLIVLHKQVPLRTIAYSIKA
ncbi:MAG: hypothetical protein A2Y23_13955 [Clostridiales bacterium GWB2_37_7]|nr:MAG: hypothetical protein A2Y23_13955 [Clostridiales bacterium GWB2_37_7]